MRTAKILSATRPCGVLVAITAAVSIALAAASEGGVASGSKPVIKAQTDGNAAWKIGCVASSPDADVAVSHCGKLLTSSDGNAWRRVEPDLRTFFRAVTFAHGVFVAVGGSYVDMRGVILTSSDGRQWTVRQCGRKTVFQSVTCGNGLFVVVGDHGTILTSKEGVDWTAQKPLFDGTLASVAFGGGRFVAVGDDGMTLSSSDGGRWAKQSSGGIAYLSKVRHDGVEFVAASGEARLRSGDGVTWKQSGGETNLALQRKD